MWREPDRPVAGGDRPIRPLSHQHEPARRGRPATPVPRLRAGLAAVALAGLAGLATSASTPGGVAPDHPSAREGPVVARAPAGPPGPLDAVGTVAALSLPALPVAPPVTGVGLDPLPLDPEIELDAPQVQRLMLAAGFPREEIGTGVAITKEESGRVPSAVNTRAAVGNDRGLWQINDHYWERELAAGDWQDPLHNTRLAHLVWTRQGWDAWVTYDAEAMDRLPPPVPGR